jgi:hypothetical protein
LIVLLRRTDSKFVSGNSAKHAALAIGILFLFNFLHMTCPSDDIASRSGGI